MPSIIEMLKYKLQNNQKISQSQEECYKNTANGQTMSVPIVKHKRPAVTMERCESRESPPKRRRTKEDFIAFCTFVLRYTQYQSDSHTECRRVDCNLSPVWSGGESCSSDSPPSTSPTVSAESRCTKFGDGESLTEVTCHCLKPYGGRPMIECSSCLVWIHLSCAKIRKMNIPDVFICQRCRRDPSTSRKSVRVRTEAKRISV